MGLLWVGTGAVGVLAQDQASHPQEEAVEVTSPETEQAATEASAEDSRAATPAPSGQASAASQAGLVSVDFKDADIRQVLRIISLKSGVDIVAGTDVEGLVTIKLTNVPWEQALDIILRTYGFTYERKGNIVRVLTVASLEQEALATEVFALDYAKAKEVPDVIKEMLSDRGRVKFDERTNTVIVTDIPSNLFQIQEVIDRLDQRTPQAMVETKVVETRLDKNENLGINWDNLLTLSQTQTSFASSFPFKAEGTFGSLGDDFVSRPPGRVPYTTWGVLTSDPLTTLGSVGVGTLSTSRYQWVLNFLSRRTNTHIVSNPSLAVLNNQEAKIHIGEEYPIPNYSIDPTTGRVTITGYTPKNLGTVLTVTPHINPSGEIVVDLKPEVISFVGNETFTTGGTSSVSLPRFSVQNASTQVRIASGETIAIGGLVKQTDLKVEEKVPFLGDIPLVGILFKNVSRYGASDPVRQDLLVFLTVKLMEEGGQQATGTTVAQATPLAREPDAIVPATDHSSP